MRKKLLRFGIPSVIIFTALILNSCKNITSPSSSFVPADIKIDTVSYNQIGTPADTLNLYLNEETSWGLGLDTAKADSLANWFANQSMFKIEDMWFPANGPVCLRPYKTFNFVIVKLTQPDSLFYELGYNHIAPGTPDGCFPNWIHYQFNWSSGQ